MKTDKNKLITLLESEIDSLLEASNMGGSGQYKQRARAESPERVERASNLAFSTFKDVRLNDGKQLVVRFDTASSDYDVNKRSYTNLVVIPGLTMAYKKNPQHSTIARAVRDGDVQVKCGCKDFKFRYEYWVNKAGDLAKVGDKSEQYAIKNAPGETNPNNDKGPFCKHLIAVTSVFLGSLSNISKEIQSMDLEKVNEPLQENAKREEGMISLEKDSTIPAILGTPEELDANLAKDSGMSESEREEVKAVLTKDESPEEIDAVTEPDETEREIPDEVETEDVELEKDEDTDDEIALDEPELEKDDASDHDDGQELEKDENGLDINDLV